MSECTYYEEIRKTIESREISLNPRPAIQTVTPYCTHSESPAPRDMVTKVLGKMLTCQGMFAKCQLPGGYHPDTE